MTLFHALLFIPLSFFCGIRSHELDLNGPHTAGSEYRTEFYVGGVPVRLASESATLRNKKASMNDTLPCFDIVRSKNTSKSALGDVIAWSRDPPIEVRSDEPNRLRFSNFTNASDAIDYIKTLRYRCNVTQCPESDESRLHFRKCDEGRGLLGTALIWITDRPRVTSTTERVRFVEQDDPVAIVTNVSVSANRRSGIRFVHIRLENISDGNNEDLIFGNDSSFFNVTLTRTRGSDGLAIVATFHAYGSEKDCVEILKNLSYSNAAKEPNATERIVRIIVNNGKFSSLPFNLKIDVQLTNDNKLKISQIPTEIYRNFTGENRVINLAESALLTRSDPTDEFPVYRGYVSLNYTDSTWLRDPLTNLTCHSKTTTHTKLSMCTNLNSVVDLVSNAALFGLHKSTNDGILYIEFAKANFFATLASNQFPASAPWAFTFWIKFGSVDNFLSMEMKDLTLVFAAKINLRKFELKYFSQNGLEVNVTFNFGSQEFDLNAWQNFILSNDGTDIKLFANGNHIKSDAVLTDMRYASAHFRLSAGVGNDSSLLLSSFSVIDKSIKTLEARCIFGCEEQLLFNEDRISSEALHELKPYLIDGGQSITASGPASLSSYTSLLRSLQYVNFAENPNQSPRQINFQVSDTKYDVSHTTHLLHLCKECGSNVTCVINANDSPVCQCSSPDLHYDSFAAQCLPPDNCSRCPHRSQCIRIRPTHVRCECELGFAMSANMECINVDDCLRDECQNGATCVDKVNGYECQCPDYYSGTFCEQNNDPCDREVCQNNGACSRDNSTKEGYKCTCPTGYNGKNCTQHLERQNNGTCHNGTCDNNTRWTTTVIVIVVISGGMLLVVIGLLIVLAVFLIRKRKATVLKVEGKRRQRFRYSQYSVETRGSSMEKRQKSKTSYSFVQENGRPILTHDELKKDSRAAVRRLSVAFADISMATATGKAAPMPPGIFSKSRQLGEFNTYGLYTQRADSLLGIDSSDFLTEEEQNEEEKSRNYDDDDDDVIDHLPGDDCDNESSQSLTSFELPVGTDDVTDKDLIIEGTTRGARLALNSTKDK